MFLNSFDEIEGGLRRCGEHNAGSIALGQLTETVENWCEQPWWQRLSLVQNDYTARQVVQLACLATSVGEQALEQLHSRGDHNRGVPVLGG